MAGGESPLVGGGGGDPVADLARCDVLAGASPDQLRSLAELLTPGTADAGAVLVRRGDVADRFLFLTTGTATVLPGAAAHREPVELPAGSIAGEIALLRGKPHESAVTAASAVRFLAGDLAAFQQLLALPGAGPRVVRQARQRWAADLPPVPMRLPGGSTVRLRPVIPADAEEVLRHPERSSDESRYRRFFRPGPPPARDLRRLADADYVDHFAWVAIDDQDVPVGEGSFFRLPPDGTEAEISLWLADDVQGHGLGSHLLGALAVAARVHGITRFCGDVLDENAMVRGILDRAGARWSTAEYGVVHGSCAVPAPDFGIDPRTAAELREMVLEVWLRPHAGAGPPSRR